MRNRTHPKRKPHETPAAPPTVSVLVKAYNHAPYVRKTIESVLEQSFQDFEIVVTDDASTDATAEVVRSFGDTRIRLEVLTRNQGMSGAMNANIRRARGRYLAILNSDDWALPDRLRRQVDFLDANPDVSLLFGLPRPVDEAGEPTSAYSDFALPLTLPDFSRRSWLRQFFFSGNCLCAPTAMVRREAYQKVGPYDRRLTNLQDLDMWVRMLVSGHEIHFIPEELTALRIRDDAANVSAPRPDTRLRCAWETTKILKHFTGLDARLFDDAFGPEAGVGASADTPIPLRVAELALSHPGIAHQNFALGVFYEAAEASDGCDRLRALSGSVDALGIREMDARDRAIEELRHVLQSRDRSAEELRDAVEQMRRLLQSRDSSIEELRHVLQSRDSSVDELRHVLQSRDRSVEELRHAVEQMRRLLQSRDSSIEELRRVLQSKDRSVQELREILQARDRSVEELRDAVEQMRRLLQSRDRSIEELRRDLQSKDRSVQELRHALQLRDQSVDELNGALEYFRRATGELTEAVRSRDHSIRELKDVLQFRDCTVEALTDAAATRERHLAETMSALADRAREVAESRLDVSRLLGELARLAAMHREAESETRALRGDLEASQATLESMRRSLSWRLTAVIRWIERTTTKPSGRLAPR